MRRSTSDTLKVSAFGNRLAAQIERGQVDVERVIGVLEPFATAQRSARLKHVFKNRISAVTVVLDSLHDPHNGAAVVRTSEAFGLSTIHVIEENESFLAHAAVARGTHKWMEVRAHPEPRQCVEELTASGHRLVAAHPKGTLLPADLASFSRVALVLGNEHEGISAVLRDSCEELVRIPMRGFAESLNVSVSAAILLAYATAEREGDLSEQHQRRLYARGLAVTVPNAAALLEANDSAW